MRIEQGAYFSRTVHDQLFAPSDPQRRLVSARLELIPLLADSGRVCALEREVGPSSVALLRRFGAARGWREARDANGAPRFHTPQAATATFAPGGQLAVVAPPSASIGELVDCLTRTLVPLREYARQHGIDLVASGIDPRNNVLDAPLQAANEHTARLSSYLDTLGPSGARYLRQSAGLSIHLDGGRTPGSRWRLLSDLSPYLTAIFATSRHYAGLDSGLQSYRAYCRRTLDPSRTGVPVVDGDARDAYLEFALDAVDAFRRHADGTYPSYRDSIATGDWSSESWKRHLGTLYPEVRPRGHLELCAIDAIPLRWLAAPLVLACGITYDDATAAEVRSLVENVDDAVLWRAAGSGLHEPSIATVCRQLVELGLRGARALGASYVSAEMLGVAREFFEAYTLRGRALADEARVPTAPPKAAPRLVVINGAFGLA